MNTNEEKEELTEELNSINEGSFAEDDLSLKEDDRSSDLLFELIAKAESRSKKGAERKEIIDDAREQDISENENYDLSDDLENEDNEFSGEPVILISKNESLENKKNKIAEKIRNSEILKPETIRDMFFGSRINERQHGLDRSFEDDYEYDCDEEAPVLFGKKRGKRITADPAHDKIIFSIEYMLTPDQALDGYMLFYNEFIKRSNIRVTAVFGVLAAIFLFSVLLSPKGYLNYLLLLITLSIIAMKWINSAGAKRDALLSADDVKNDSYRLDFYNSRILLQASEPEGDKIYNYPPVMIRFEDIDLKVLDYDDLYVLIFKKDYVYTVPKKAMSEDQNRSFRSRLENILGDDYYEFYSREKAAEEKAARRKEKQEKRQDQKNKSSKADL